MYPKCTLIQKQSNCFWAYANGRLRIRERLFGLTRTVARRLLAPCTRAQRTFSAYFALPVCLLRNSRLLTLDQPFTPYVLQATSSSHTCECGVAISDLKCECISPTIVFKVQGAGIRIGRVCYASSSGFSSLYSLIQFFTFA